ncbi:MAG: enoyl-CoA hydratase-related protein [Desulfobacteraceae bacterium]
MERETILYQLDEGIAWVTLNRPKVRNAISRALLEDLKSVLEELETSPDARVVVITGAGDKAFCAGADLKERAGMTPEEVDLFLTTIGRIFSYIENYKLPVIAAINGSAFGGGLELAMAADIRLAAESAVVGLTETRLAIIPGAGGTQRLPRIVGRGKAKELILTGRRIGAREALNIGLMNHVFANDRLLAESRKMALEISAGGPIAVQQAKRAINDGLETDLQKGLSIESKAYAVCIPTEDRLEGLKAFREKRKPAYKGK